MPTSENAMTGVGIGLSMGGFIPIMTHQRLDFSLLSFDQIINSAAKWFFMFGGKKNVQITIRLIVGRGWGQGPTHSQSMNPGRNILLQWGSPHMNHEACRRQMAAEKLSDLLLAQTDPTKTRQE